MKLKTQRLILRPLIDSDAKSIYENINDLDVAKWMRSIPYPYKLKDAKHNIKRSKERWKMKNKEMYHFGIELRDEKKIIGGISINGINKKQKTATLGYWIGKKYHGKGYGTESLGEILKFGFIKLKLRRIEAEVFPGNPSSGKLLEKFGAKQEGLKRKSSFCLADGKIKDTIIYGLLKEDWKK